VKVQITSLRLVFPPISNQVADWLKGDPDVETVLRKSNLYMMAQREEAKFTTVRWLDPDLHLLEVNLRLGDAVNDSCVIDLHEVAERHPIQDDHRLEVLAGSFGSPDAGQPTNPGWLGGSKNPSVVKLSSWSITRSRGTSGI
jgi:hypothetical protein